MKSESTSHVWLFAATGVVACQAPLSMGFSRQEYWGGLPFPSPGDLPDPGTKSGSPTFQMGCLPSEPSGKCYLWLVVNGKHLETQFYSLLLEFGFFIFFFNYLFGCIWSQLWHTGSSLYHVGSVFGAYGHSSCGTSLVALGHMWSYFPYQGSNPHPLHQKALFLTTGLPGNSLVWLFKSPHRSEITTYYCLCF